MEFGIFDYFRDGFFEDLSVTRSRRTHFFTILVAIDTLSHLNMTSFSMVLAIAAHG